MKITLCHRAPSSHLYTEIRTIYMMVASIHADMDGIDLLYVGSDERKEHSLALSI